MSSLVRIALIVVVVATIVLLLLLAISALAVVLTGGLAEQVGKVLGIGQTAVDVWDIAKWPVLLLVVGFMFSLLYWAAPNVKQPGFRWLTPGGLLAVLIWIAISLLFLFAGAPLLALIEAANETAGDLMLIQALDRITGGETSIPVAAAALAVVGWICLFWAAGLARLLRDEY